MASPADRALTEIVDDVISTDDPALCHRACAALCAMLAEYADNVD